MTPLSDKEFCDITRDSNFGKAYIGQSPTPNSCSNSSPNKIDFIHTSLIELSDRSRCRRFLNNSSNLILSMKSIKLSSSRSNSLICKLSSFVNLANSSKKYANVGEYFEKLILGPALMCNFLRVCFSHNLRMSITTFSRYNCSRDSSSMIKVSRCNLFRSSGDLDLSWLGVIFKYRMCFGHADSQ